jgi:hypothetical protein
MATVSAPPPRGIGTNSGDAEVSWLGVVARSAFPAGLSPKPVAIAADSPLTVAGAAPVLHRTSLSHRRHHASTRRDEPSSGFRCSTGKYWENHLLRWFGARFLAAKSLESGGSPGKFPKQPNRELNRPNRELNRPNREAPGKDQAALSPASRDINLYAPLGP